MSRTVIDTTRITSYKSQRTGKATRGRNRCYRDAQRLIDLPLAPHVPPPPARRSSPVLASLNGPVGWRSVAKHTDKLVCIDLDQTKTTSCLHECPLWRFHTRNSFAAVPVRPDPRPSPEIYSPPPTCLYKPRPCRPSPLTPRSVLASSHLLLCSNLPLVANLSFPLFAHYPRNP